MSEKFRTYPGGTFFITLTVVGWIDVFTRSEYCDLIIKNLMYCIETKSLLLYRYCIMPSHIHMIAGSGVGNLGDIIRDFKGFTSREIIKRIKNNSRESRRDWLMHMFSYHGKYKRSNKTHQFWQHGLYPIDLKTDKMFFQKMEYIDNNPVEAGIVDSSEHYVYCSAYYNSPVKLEAF